VSTVEQPPSVRLVRGGRRGNVDPQTRRQVEAALAHRRVGADLDRQAVRDLVDRALPPIAGGAVGEVAAQTYQGVPVDEFFVVSPELFNQATILNTWQSPLKAIPGFGNPDRFDIPGRGLLSQIEIVFTGTLTCTPGTGTITATDLWPYGLFSNFSLRLNGSPIINAHGTFFEYRRKVKTRNAPDAMTSAPTASGANTVEIHWLINVSEDQRDLYGAVLSQADDLYISLEYVQEALGNLFALTGNAAVALTGNLQLNYFAFDVPVVPINGVQRGVLPDLDVLHRVSEFSTPATTGDTELRLQQTGGVIERMFVWIDNTAGSLIDPASWSRVRMQFAETEEPITLPASVALSMNARHYFGRIAPKALVVDFTAWDRPERDGVYPKGVANPKLIVTLPGTITPNAGARVFAVQESLIGAG
jgi:hypothetical protein